MLEPILAKAFIRRGSALLIKLGDKEIDFNPDFKLYLLTKLGERPCVQRPGASRCLEAHNSTSHLKIAASHAHHTILRAPRELSAYLRFVCISICRQLPGKIGPSWCCDFHGIPGVKLQAQAVAAGSQRCTESCVRCFRQPTLPARSHRQGTGG